MVRPCYVYLKLKMLGPNRVITISGDFKHSHKCKIASANITESLFVSEEWAEIQKSVDAEQLPPIKRPATESSFQSTRDTKKVPVHPEDPSKTAQITIDLPAQ